MHLGDLPGATDLGNAGLEVQVHVVDLGGALGFSSLFSLGLGLNHLVFLVHLCLIRG